MDSTDDATPAVDASTAAACDSAVEVLAGIRDLDGTRSQVAQQVLLTAIRDGSSSFGEQAAQSELEELRELATGVVSDARTADLELLKIRLLTAQSICMDAGQSTNLPESIVDELPDAIEVACARADGLRNDINEVRESDFGEGRRLQDLRIRLQPLRDYLRSEHSDGNFDDNPRVRREAVSLLLTQRETELVLVLRAYDDFLDACP